MLPGPRTPPAAAATAITLLAALLAGPGCDDEPRAIDPFPVRFDPSAGPVLLGVDAGGGPRPAVIDTLAAITLLDPLASGGDASEARRRRVTLTLLGLDDAGQPTIPRARFPDTTAIELHPCPGPDPCTVGLGDRTAPFAAVLGADVLGRSAVRIDFSAGELRFFPDTPGSEAELGSECMAVFGNAFAGGGTLLVDGTEVPFSGRRPVLGACLDQAGAPQDEERGTDALLLLSTGLGTSVLAASAYDRYAAATGAPARDGLPEAILHLATGPTPVRVGEVGRMALVGRITEEGAERGPCRELHLNHLVSVNACETLGLDCPCPDDESFCRAAAAIELDRPIQVAILPDDHPLLQSLRDELRPSYPEVDGIVGTNALAPLRVELDYPNGRLLMRCREGGTCATRPAVRSRSSVDTLARCRAAEEASAPDAGPNSDAGADGGAEPDAGPADAGAGAGAAAGP